MMESMGGSPIPTQVTLEWNGNGFEDLASKNNHAAAAPATTATASAKHIWHELIHPLQWSRKTKIIAVVIVVLLAVTIGLAVGLSTAPAVANGSVYANSFYCTGSPCPSGECRSGVTGECGFGLDFCNVNTTWAVDGCCPKKDSPFGVRRLLRELQTTSNSSTSAANQGVPRCDGTFASADITSNGETTSTFAVRVASCGHWYDYLNPCCLAKCPAGNMFDECNVCCSCNAGLKCSSAALVSGAFKTTCLPDAPATPSVNLAKLNIASDKASTPIANVRFLYAHDSMTTYFDGKILSQNVFQGIFESTLFPFVVTQPVGSIQTLLNCGARAFDLRVLQITSQATVTAMNAAGFPAKLNDIVFEHGPIPVLYFFSQAMKDAIAWSDANKGDDANLVLFMPESCDNCASGVLEAQYTAAGIPFVSPSQLGSMTYAQALALARTKNNGGVLLGVTGLPGRSNFQEDLRCRFFRTESINCFSSSHPLDGMKSYMQGLITSSHGVGDQVQALWQSPLTSTGGTSEFVLSGSTLSSDESKSALNYLLYKELIQNDAWSQGSFNLWKIDNVCDWGPALNERFRALNGFMQILDSPKSLTPGQALISSNGLYRFTFQKDGNLVIYAEKDGSVIWSPNVFSSCPSSLAMQADCNLVAYDCQNHAYFSTGTFGRRGPCYLKMQVDRNLVLYGADGAYFASGTFI